ncbi:MAG: hypothetical protein J0M24_19060 [Verrucomicrobia bacterium]|nr:hypothetical protein [Verrucomicrobiota bacterium]
MKKLLLPLLLTALQAAAADLLIVVESTLNSKVTPSLDQYIADAKAEGWTVETVKWPARSKKDTTAHVRLAQQVIWPRAKASSDLHVMMIGSLPMPYSGFNLLPDGHTDTVGAYATTLYYACPDAKWTDIRDNSGYRSKTQFINRPGDGKFDQQVGPGGTSVDSIAMGKLQAKIGFLDLSTMGTPKSWGSTNTAVDLQANAYIQYFKRNHEYRTGQWSPKLGAGNGAYTKKPTGYFQDWAYKTVGTNNYCFFFSSVASKTQPYTPQEMGAFSVVYDFKALPYQSTYWSTVKGPWAVLDLSYGSYQIDFGAQRLVNPLVTGALATANSATGAWDLTGIFEGKTLGQLWGQTVNRGLANTYCVLYGDPTLVVRKP